MQAWRTARAVRYHCEAQRHGFEPHRWWSFSGHSLLQNLTIMMNCILRLVCECRHVQWLRLLWLVTCEGFFSLQKNSLVIADSKKHLKHWTVIKVGMDKKKLSSASCCDESSSIKSLIWSERLIPTAGALTFVSIKLVSWLCDNCGDVTSNEILFWLLLTFCQVNSLIWEKPLM